MARKVAKGKRKASREKPEHVRRVAKQYALQRGVEKEATTNCTPLMKMTVKSEEAIDHEEDLQAWGLLEESETEQRQEVISKRDKHKVILSVENRHNSSSKKIIEVKDSRRSKQRAKKNQSSVTVERGEQSQFESEEDCGGERQRGESQSHHELWSRGSCDA